MQLFADTAKRIPNIEKIILYGKEEPNRANILLIGENISSDEINPIIAEINERYGYKISTLRLTQEQYEQMLSMGLYPNEKKVLFAR